MGRPALPRRRQRSRVEEARAQLDEARARMYHDVVLEAAEHVFGARGYDDATMRDVAREAGISLKTLYATFPGKRDLYREIQTVRGRAFMGAVDAAVAEGSGAFDRLSRAARAYVDFLVAHRDWLRIHLQERIGWGLGPAAGEDTQLWRTGIESFAQIVRAGIEEGAFHRGDPETLARMGIAVMQVQLARALEGGGADADALADEIVLHLSRLLCRDPAA